MTLDGLMLMCLGALLGAVALECFRARGLVRRLQHIALASHELRGALTAIDLALTKAERMAELPDRPRLEAVRRGYDRAAAVAHDLDVARGALPARVVQRPEPVDLREVACRVVQTWNASVPSGGRRIALDWREGAAVVNGFPMRLVQALDNLVANALEHGRGPVTVAGRAAGDWISVCVLDRGAGVTLPLERMRARSWQARRGHGLVVARHAVELHGGTLRSVQWPSGAGIEIRLPAADGCTPVRSGRWPRVPRRSGWGAAAS